MRWKQECLLSEEREARMFATWRDDAGMSATCRDGRRIIWVSNTWRDESRMAPVRPVCARQLKVAGSRASWPACPAGHQTWGYSRHPAQNYVRQKNRTLQVSKTHFITAVLLHSFNFQTIAGNNYPYIHCITIQESNKTYPTHTNNWRYYWSYFFFRWQYSTVQNAVRKRVKQKNVGQAK